MLLCLANTEGIFFPFLICVLKFHISDDRTVLIKNTLPGKAVRNTEGTKTFLNTY